MKDKLKKEKEKLLALTFEDLNKICPKGIYSYMEMYIPELEERFLRSESKIHSIYKQGTINEFKQALEEMWYLHVDLVGRIADTASKAELMEVVN